MANEHQTRLFTDEDHPLVSKSWLLKQLHSDEVEQRFKLPKMQSVLLLNRDVNSADEASQYIASDETLSCDPKLMPNIEEGTVKRLGELAENSKAEVMIISTDSEEGKSLQKAFGGLAAILRYPIN